MILAKIDWPVVGIVLTALAAVIAPTLAYLRGAASEKTTKETASVTASNSQQLGLIESAQRVQQDLNTALNAGLARCHKECAQLQARLDQLEAEHEATLAERDAKITDQRHELVELRVKEQARDVIVPRLDAEIAALIGERDQLLAALASLRRPEGDT